ncbi:hypothetical protein ZHAS_00004139 [Anopheles sinensis]|uniref:Uncharacterized protein n=1 Tax=Anopheles sinensis TaxID=74873 RepID=A0A084VG75_ANOSI|nr:hypothetical protein ZHAS_00004139 [Anopheles sinensis]
MLPMTQKRAGSFVPPPSVFFPAARLVSGNYLPEGQLAGKSFAIIKEKGGSESRQTVAFALIDKNKPFSFWAGVDWVRV